MPDDRQPYAAQSVEVPDPPGFDPVTVEVGLTRGIWIEGTVTDKRTGKPVRLTEVNYYPDAFENKTAPAGYASKERFFPTVTHADGKFRVLGLAGKGYLTARAIADEYLTATDRTGEGGSKQDSLSTLPSIVSAGNNHAVYEIDVPAATDPFRRAVTLDGGLRFVVALVGPDGKPVAGAQAFAHSALTHWSEEAEPGRHRIESYNVARPRLVLFRQVEKNLVGTLQVPANFDADTHTVRLAAGVVIAGRAVDADGRPKAGVKVALSFQRHKDAAWAPYTPAEETYATDAEGRFRVVGLVPGFRYAVVLDGVHKQSFMLDTAATGTKDLGDLRLDSGEK